MIDVQLHLHGADTQRVKMPTVPAEGSYITHGGKVWRVAYVVHGENSTTWGRGRVDVYALQVAGPQCDKLTRSWVDWSTEDEHTP
jgi:hypothetical protein